MQLSSIEIARDNWDNTKSEILYQVNINRCKNVANSRRKKPGIRHVLFCVSTQLRARNSETLYSETNSWCNVSPEAIVPRTLSVFHAGRSRWVIASAKVKPVSFSRRANVNRMEKLTHRRIIEVWGRRDFQDIIHSALVRRILQRNGRR